MERTEQRGWEEKRDVMWIYPQQPLPLVLSAGSLCFQGNTHSDLQKAEVLLLKGAVKWSDVMMCQFIR